MSNRSAIFFISLFLCVLNFDLSAQNLDPETTNTACADGIDNDGDGLIDCLDPDCIENEIQSCIPCFENPPAFADTVEIFLPACGDTSNLYLDPQQALGYFDFDGFNEEGKFVSIGSGGLIQLGFTDNILVNSGDALADLGHYEVGADRESVFISLRPYDSFTALVISMLLDDQITTEDFWDVGIITGGYEGLDIDSFFDFRYEFGRLRFDGIRIMDVIDGTCQGSSPGADVDAVCSHYNIIVEQCNNGIDDDGDGLLDEMDPDCNCNLEASIEIQEFGNICTGDLIIGISEIEGASYQWYQDGILMNGETSSSLDVNASYAYYELYISQDTGCIKTIQYPVFEQVYMDTLVTQICEGESIMFYDTLIGTSGIYSYVDTAQSDGCDSIIKLDLMVIERDSFFIDRTICEGDSIFFNGEVIREAGFFVIDTDSVSGCDSVAVLQVEIEDLPMDSIELQYCSGDSILFEGQTYNSDTSFMVSRPSTLGCDTTILVSISGLAGVEIDTSVTICEGDTFSFMDNPYWISDTYLVQLVTDSVCINYNLEINLRERTEMDTLINICSDEVILFNGQLYFDAGVYQQVFDGVNGCDSIINITIEQRNPVTNDLSLELCDGESVILNDISYDSPGLYTQVLTSVNGCDSILNIEIVSVDTADEFEQIEICQGDTLEIEGLALTDEGVYSFDKVDENDCLYQLTIELTTIECDDCFLPLDHKSISSVYAITRKSESLYELNFGNNQGLIIDNEELHIFLIYAELLEYCERQMPSKASFELMIKNHPGLLDMTNDNSKVATVNQILDCGTDDTGILYINQSAKESRSWISKLEIGSKYTRN